MTTYIARTPPSQEWAIANKLRLLVDDVIMPLEWTAVPPKPGLALVCARARPLYKGYLFVRTDRPADLPGLARIHGVKWMSQAGRDEPYRLTPVQSLMLRSMMPTFPDTLKRIGQQRFSPGQLVRVIDGPLAGQTLTVEDDSGGHHVATLWAIFGALTPMRVPANKLSAA